MRHWLIIYFVAMSYIGVTNAQQLVSLKQAKSIAALASSEVEVSTVKDSSLHPAANNESWYLSGLLENEQADRFAYYFVVQRVNDRFTYFTQIISLQTGKIIFKKSQSSILSLATRQGINFKIADGFLRYNEINDSWTFGVNNKQGFNLRVESLQLGSYNINPLNLLSFYTLQSKRVNGQLTLENKPDFVISSNAWISHQWRSPRADKSIRIERLLCRFLDNQGVMLVRAYKDNDVIFSLADLLDSHGESHAVSQFSLLSQTTPLDWHVKLFPPQKVFDITSAAPLKSVKGSINTSFYLGAAKQSNKNNFIGSCMVIKENIVKDSVVNAVRKQD